jgi:hypothetical protein
MSQGPTASLAMLRRRLTAATIRRSLLFSLTWLSAPLVVASLESTIDPMTAWEHLLNAMFGLFIPLLGLTTTLGLFRTLADPTQPTALVARHGANRRQGFAVAVMVGVAQALLLTSAGLLLSRVFCHPATEPIWNRDLLVCCGIGCLATGAYIAYLLAATRLGFGRAGAWMALGLDLTLGHVNAGWAFAALHRHVANLIGHPSDFSLSAGASSWILLGFMLLGLTFATARTPR